MTLPFSPSLADVGYRTAPLRSAWSSCSTSVDVGSLTDTESLMLGLSTFVGSSGADAATTCAAGTTGADTAARLAVGASGSTSKEAATLIVMKKINTNTARKLHFLVYATRLAFTSPAAACTVFDSVAICSYTYLHYKTWVVKATTSWPFYIGRKMKLR